MNCQVQSVCCFKSCRGIDRIGLTDVVFTVQTFVVTVLRMYRDPPHLVVRREGELGEFIQDNHRIQAVLFRKGIPETHSIVKNPELYVQQAFFPAGFLLNAQ